MELQQELAQGHIIRTLMEENQATREHIARLRQLNSVLQGMDEEDEKTFELNSLEAVAANLLEVKLHHQREEQVLFPEMEKRGISAPLVTMRMEHLELQVLEHAFEALSHARIMDYSLLQSQVKQLVDSLLYDLEKHIFKEDYLLYPHALEVILAEEVWARMKDDCEAIGNCRFQELPRRRTQKAQLISAL